MTKNKNLFAIGLITSLFFIWGMALNLNPILIPQLIIFAVLLLGSFPVYALLGIDFFMSIMFPTIFSLSIRGLGKKTKESSSLVIMAIVGGAVCALLFGYIADKSNIQLAYLIPGFCFLYLLFYSIKRIKTEGFAVTAAH